MSTDTFVGRMQKKPGNMALRYVFVQAATDANENFSKIHNSSLMKKLRRAYRQHEYEPGALAMSRLASTLLYLFLSTTSLYCCMRYSLPWYLQDIELPLLGDWTIYYAKVFAVYVFIQVTSNWMCVQLYSTDFRKTADIPHLDKNLWEAHPGEKNEENRELTNGSATYASEKKRLPWYYCPVCQLHCPPRCHHCRVCGKCILKRDHHCFMLGTCVGFYNQRYFVILAFYLTLAGYFGMYFTYQYMKVHFLSTCEWADLFLPYTMYRFVMFDLEHQYMLMIWHLYFLWVGGSMGLGFFSWQIAMIALGRTTHEGFMHVKMKTTSTVSENFRSVFGPFWFLNFFFPAVILFRQQADGTNWDNVQILY